MKGIPAFRGKAILNGGDHLKIVSWTGSPRPCVPSNTASRAPARSTWRAIPASDVPTAHPRPKYGSLLDKTAEKSMHVLAISSSEAHFGGRRFAFDPAYNYIPVPVRSRTVEIRKCAFLSDKQG